MKTRIIIFSFFLVLILSFSIFYPQPSALIVSWYRFFNLPIDYNTEAIKPLLDASVNQDAVWIEKFVKEQVPYRYDWQNYNYPWYFPTVEEVLEKESGDCKSRLIILASIFTFYEIPFSFSGSHSHVWLDYENKKEIKGEKQEEIIVSYSKEKGFEFKKAKIDWEASSSIFKKAVWVYMPQNKKILLFQVWFSCFVFTVFSLMISGLKDSKIKKI